jgi:hypothetical protein
MTTEPVAAAPPQREMAAGLTASRPATAMSQPVAPVLAALAPQRPAAVA